MFSSQNSQVSNDANYIEDVFSTYLIKTPGSATAVGAVNNAIDLSTKGGMVWLKDRNFAYSHTLVDSARGVTQRLISDSTAAQASTSTYGFTSFNTNGFTLGAGGGALFDNGAAGTNVVTWTFRKQPKFFDVVTWTGNNVNGRVIPHSLDAEVGFIAVKAITTSANDNNWVCRHRSQTSPDRLYLNTTAAASGSTNLAPTTTGFTVYANGYNETGVQYVAYLFAHNAGGFGLTGTDNVISCGSYTHNSTSGVDVNLGYEPQWILQKNAGAASGWLLIDNMRGWVVDANDQYLTANSSGVEDNIVNSSPTATGFKVDAGAWANGANIIYIAIRRGPMKVPTSGTSVFSPNATSGTTNTQITTNFPLDLNIVRDRTASTGFQSGFAWSDRLRELSSTTSATTTGLQSTNANAETTGIWGLNKFVDNIGFKIAADYSGLSQIYYSFRRAPSFFDEVCYTGTGVARTVTHNLGVAPQLMIIKNRTNAATNWRVYYYPNSGMILNATNAGGTSGTVLWNDTDPTASVFSLGTNSDVNGSGYGNYVAYLFATCAGVSKVGSYTGNGSSQTINCGFTGGARFVLIKRTDSTGDWYVWDTARGIIAANDPHLSLNTTAAEITTDDTIDTDSTGFVVNQVAATNVNVTSATYIFLAIA